MKNKGGVKKKEKLKTSFIYKVPYPLKSTSNLLNTVYIFVFLSF